MRTTTLLAAALLVLLQLAVAGTAQQELPSSQTKAILRLRRLLFNPSSMGALPTAGDICSLPHSAAFAVSCSGGGVSAVSILGERKVPLPSDFSSDAVFTTLASLTGLTSISLVSLGMWGPLSAKLHRLPELQLLNLSSNFLYGAVPPELTAMGTLRFVVLSGNALNGTMPLFKGAVELRVENNSFRSRIDAAAVAAMTELQELDLSHNHFFGWIPPSLFSLPSIRSISLSHNQFDGQLPASISCGAGLALVDISDNLFSGTLPRCLAANSSTITVLYAGNCLSSVAAAYQHSNGYCNPGAIAAVLPPTSGGVSSGGEKKRNTALIAGILAGVFGGAMLIGLSVFLVARKVISCRGVALGRGGATSPAKMKTDVAKAMGLVPLDANGRRTPANKRHVTQAAKAAVLEVAPYRVFTLDELKEATDCFNATHLIKDSRQEKHYRGRLRDGSMAVIRCLKLKEKFQNQSLAQYMDTVSKLRHRHLVSIIGHCFAGNPDSPNTYGVIYLVSEYISNGNLRTHLTEWRKREMLKWPQRVGAAVGIARGIQFLHGVAVPGIVGNDLNIENILLDQTLTAKISNFNLPSLPCSKNKVGPESPFAVTTADDIRSIEEGEKRDIFQFGLILLELITGKPAEPQKQLLSFISQPRRSITEEPDALKGLADPTIHGTFALDSLRTVTELAVSCMSEDPRKRPSIDDVLWHLQYSMQVQDGWASSESLSFTMQM